jgi:hypothetical protein
MTNTAFRTDRILAVCAIITAVVAVAIAVYEARITREHQKISVWPYLMPYNSLPTGGPYTLNVTNRGIGPARIGRVTVRVDGEPRRNWADVVHTLIDARPDFVYSSIRRGTVILPGATVELIRVPAGDDAIRVWRALQTHRFQMEICYCSLYGECWVATGGPEEPPPVRACHADPDAEFGL